MFTIVCIAEMSVHPLVTVYTMVLVCPAPDSAAEKSELFGLKDPRFSTGGTMGETPYAWRRNSPTGRAYAPQHEMSSARMSDSDMFARRQPVKSSTTATAVVAVRHMSRKQSITYSVEAIRTD